jgi:hypothetical protein
MLTVIMLTVVVLNVVILSVVMLSVIMLRVVAPKLECKAVMYCIYLLHSAKLILSITAF